MSKLSDNAKNKSWKYREFWNSLPDMVSSEDYKTDHYDLFQKLNKDKVKTIFNVSKDKDYE